MIKNIRDDMKRIESWCNAVETMCNVQAKKELKQKINEDDWSFIHDQRLWMHKSGYFITQSKTNGFMVFHPHGHKITYSGNLDEARFYIQNRASQEN